MNARSSAPALVLFGGLGSLSTFTSSTAATIKERVGASSAALTLASRCHDAFLSILQSLSEEELQSAALNPDDFAAFDSFLYPPARYDEHPVIELTTVCLYQLISFLSKKAGDPQDFSKHMESVEESIGFCSGLIPAAVVSCSGSVDEFLRYGVEAFRLTFWVGYRSLQYLNQNPDTCGKYCSHSLISYNISRDEMNEMIESLTIKGSDESHENFRIAAVSSNFIAVSGPCSDLEALKEHIGTTKTCRFTAVHAWYHAGSRLSEVVRQISIDAAKINFPSSAALKRRLRSTLDGELFEVSTQTDKVELSTWIIRHMLIHCVNWSDVLHKAVISYRPNQHDAVRIESFGPSTESLLTCVQHSPYSKHVAIEDLSSFGLDKSSPTQQQQNSIAIVGMAFDLPGGSNREELLNCLKGGKETSQALPSDRFNPEFPKQSSEKSYRGSYLRDMWTFDNEFFCISPREAMSMDPQQRLLLHCAHRALEDAGYSPDSTPSFQRKSIGCYIGLATGDYETRRDKKIDVYHSTGKILIHHSSDLLTDQGTLRAFHSGRIPYHYGFCGPCVTVDTACSSSAVAIYQACRALQNRECTAAVAGGINLICGSDVRTAFQVTADTNPRQMFDGLENAHFLSKSGACKPFDQSADGYGRAEGSTVFVLKRFADAIAENDRIHAVIKDAVINQSGRATSITHPSPEDQEDLIKGLLARSNVSPTTVSVIEAHGTGTQAGDVTEFSSIYNVFSRHHSPAKPLWVSSIKGNIGHCEAASGGAGLVKLILMLSNKVIFKQAGYRTPNPKLVNRLKTGSVQIPTSNTRWNASGKYPRRGILHNFGAAGSNSALLVEEPMARTRSGKSTTARSSYVFMLSAPDPEGLSRSISAHKAWLESHPELSLRDVCYTATARRQHYKHRMALPCSSKEDLTARLATPIDRVSGSDSETKLVFVFSGQGAAYKGMGKELFHTSDLFQNTILQCDQILKSLECPSILAYIKGESLQGHPSDEEIISQCACVALEIGLAKLLLSWGLRPSVVVGHSLGEFSALAVAGIISVDHIMRYTALRAKAITQFCTSGSSGMTSCTLASNDASDLINRLDTAPDLAIACENGERQSVVSGPLPQLKIFEEAAKRDGALSKRLDVPYAFHSAAMEPMMHKVDELAASITWNQPQIPMISCVTGELFSYDTDATKNYLSRHTREPVLFDSALRLLERDEASSFYLEIGPHPILLPMIRSSRHIDQDSLFPTLQRDKADWTSLSTTISEICNRGLDFNYRSVFDSSGGQLLDCPGYQFKQKKFEAPVQNSTPDIPTLPTTVLGDVGPYLRLLPAEKANEYAFIAEMELLRPFIEGHNVGGTPICPASVFLELCLQATSCILKPSAYQTVAVSNVEFRNAFVYSTSSASPTKDLFVKVSVDQSDQSAKIHISSGPDGLLHFSGETSLGRGSKVNQMKKKSEIVYNRQHNYLQQMPSHKTNHFTTKPMYDFIFPRVVRYSPDFHTLTQIKFSETIDEGIGRFQLPAKDKPKSDLAIIWYDTLFHVAGFMVNAVVAAHEICICASVESIHIFSMEIDFKAVWNVHSNVIDLGDGLFAGDVVAISAEGEAVARLDGLRFKKLPITTLQRALDTSPKQTFTPAPKYTAPSQPKDIPRFERSSVKTKPASTPETASDVGVSLSEIVCSVTGLPKADLDPSTNLKRIGIDSMLEIELVAALRSHLQQDTIDHMTISGCETLADLERAISVSPPSCRSDSSTRIDDEGSNRGDDASQDGGLSLVQSNPNDKPPLILFHDGSGTISAYTHLQSLGRDVFAFSNPRLRSKSSSFASLNEMVSEYAKTLLRAGMDRLILGGWSFGGVLAYEMARFLSQTHIEVVGLILIDAPFPIDHEPLPKEIIQHVLGDHASDTKSLIQDEFLNNAQLLGQYEPNDWSPCMSAAILHCRDVVDTESISGHTYSWLCDTTKRQNDIDSWQQLFNFDTKLIPIAGHHFDIFDKTKIDGTSKDIVRACEFLESR